MQVQVAAGMQQVGKSGVLFGPPFLTSKITRVALAGDHTFLSQVSKQVMTSHGVPGAPKSASTPLTYAHNYGKDPVHAWEPCGILDWRHCQSADSGHV